MKRILIISLLLACSICRAQTVEKIDKSQNKFGFVYKAAKDSKIPSIDISRLRAEKDTKLPKYVDNTINKYFPPTVSQIGGSCAQASGVGYVYTYELNYLLDRDAKKLENNLSYMQMWNYLNDGVGNGSFTPDGWDLIKSNGVALSTDFKPTSSSIGNTTIWPNGYDIYYRGMHNRVASHSKFVPYPNGEEGEYVDIVPAMKHYLFDHNTGAAHGGLIIFTAYADPLDCDKNYKPDPNDKTKNPSHTGYQSIIPFFPETGGHAMTFAGYDDAVEYDVNKNGTIEEEEKGAFIAMNSWGENWGDKGRFYVPYILLKKKKKKEGGTGTGSKNCYIVTPKIVEPKLTFKVLLSHNSRNDIAFKMGITKTDPNAELIKPIEVKVMSHAGGDHNLTGLYGSDNEIIEVGIDASELLELAGNNKNVKFYLELADKVYGETGTGELIDCTLLDYRKDKNNPIAHMSSIEAPKVLKDLTARANFANILTEIKPGKQFGIEFTLSNYNKKGVLNLRSLKTENINADLVDQEGKIIKNIFKGEVTDKISSTTIDFKDLEKGTYAIKITSIDRLIYKIIKIK